MVILDYLAVSCRFIERHKGYFAFRARYRGERRRGSSGEADIFQGIRFGNEHHRILILGSGYGGFAKFADVQ